MSPRPERSCHVAAKLIGFAILCFASSAHAANAPSCPPGELIESVKKLADPRWEGRGLGTAGIDSAANWIAARMQSLGLKPGGERGTWFQSVEVTTGVEVVAPSGITIGKDRISPGDLYQPIGFSTNGTVTAPVVFAGYGISAPGFDYDDYAGIDVRDKLVLVLSQEPGEMDSTSRFDGSVNTAHSELRTKAIAAREHGAIGLLVVHGPRWHAGEYLPRARTDGGGYMTSGLLAAWVSERTAERMLAASGLTLAAAQAAIEAHGRPHSLALEDSVTLTVSLKRARANTRNVVGWLPGRDTTRTLVIGAHYDHLGYGGESSLAPNFDVPHVGADDNASGTAALIGLACALRPQARGGKGPEHNLVFAAFTGEESGLIGSSHFVDDPTRPIESVEAMINFDMVGRLRDDRLMVMGAGTAQEFAALLDNVNRAGGAPGAKGAFTLRTSNDGYGPSDHSSFYKRDIPVLMLFTGAHADYHKPSDTWDKVNASGLERVTKFATALVESLDVRPRVKYVRAKADSSTGRIAGGGGYGAYLGTIPDYMQTEGGVLLSGVRTGSPADSAGLKGGDVIVRFDDIRVDNIYDYTFALRSRKPGQKVHITVKRAGTDVELLATLGRRSR